MTPAADHFVIRASDFLRHSDFVISPLVNGTMGKLPELAHISKWKSFRAAVTWNYATRQFV
jgi:hypothetical protein